MLAMTTELSKGLGFLCMPLLKVMFHVLEYKLEAGETQYTSIILTDSPVFICTWTALMMH
ncbi:Uncharacterised protein [Mycobacterium tuberculosis]|nr:Uncharacterised protein [Mycobacterium tuberculosis]